MKRRDFIAGQFAGSAMTSAHVAKAREAIPRIGYLGTSVPTAEAFREGLRKLGYIEGQSIIVEYRWGRGHANELAATPCR